MKCESDEHVWSESRIFQASEKEEKNQDLGYGRGKKEYICYDPKDKKERNEDKSKCVNNEG